MIKPVPAIFWDIDVVDFDLSRFRNSEKMALTNMIVDIVSKMILHPAVERKSLTSSLFGFFGTKTLDNKHCD
jgi:hypothetical protein